MDVYLKDHFVTILLIVGFSLKLVSSWDSRDNQVKYLWLSVICTAVLVVQDIAESLCSEDPSLITWRTLLSILGFVLRPVSALGLLLAVAHRFPHRELLWMPAWINGAVMCTAFFSPLAFYFDESYAFTRGVLGFVPFAVGFLYIILILFFTWKAYGFHRSWEGAALYWCGLGTVVCTFIDALHGGARLNQAIMISAIFYYIFLRSHDVNLDRVTGLLNRTAYFRDSETREGSITGMAMLDLLGLRALNDSLGLKGADQALANIGKCMQQAASRQISCYRLGDGDFLMVFYGPTEKESRFALQQARTAIHGLGHRMCVGYAARSTGESPEALFRRTEQAMHEDRVAFYQRPANNRRHREKDDESIQ